MRFEAHFHGSEPLNLTPFVQGADYIESTSPQGGPANVTLTIPLTRFFKAVPERTGWWLVIRDDLGAAVWWGRVSSVRAGRTVGAGDSPELVSSKGTQISAEPFVSLVNAAQIVMAAANVTTIPGALYLIDTWQPLLAGWLKAFKFKKPGGLLNTMWLGLARTFLPESLGGQSIGEAVLVGHDFLTVSPERAGVQVDVPGVAANAFGNIQPRGTIWTSLMGAFGADPRLVEIFPSLDAPSVPTLLSAALGGSQPYLNFRIKPLFTAPLLDPDALAAGIEVPTPSYIEALEASQLIPRDDVVDFDATWSDDARINGFFARSAISPGSQMGAYGVLGVPQFDFASVVQHGLRFYEVNWPFFPHDLTSAATTQLAIKIQGLISMAQALTEEGETYASGALTLRYSPGLKAGTWRLFDLGEADARWLCYVSSVEHSITVNPKSKVERKRTQVIYERGFLFP